MTVTQSRPDLGRLDKKNVLGLPSGRPCRKLSVSSYGSCAVCALIWAKRGTENALQVNLPSGTNKSACLFGSPQLSLILFHGRNVEGRAAICLSRLTLAPTASSGYTQGCRRGGRNEVITAKLRLFIPKSSPTGSEKLTNRVGEVPSSW